MVDSIRVGENLDYTFDFAPKTNNTINDGKDYLETGETLVTKLVTVTGTTLDSDEFVNTNTGVKFWISPIAGEEGEITVICECTTSTSPRKVIRSMTIKCEPAIC